MTQLKAKQSGRTKKKPTNQATKTPIQIQVIDVCTGQQLHTNEYEFEINETHRNTFYFLYLCA